MKYLFIRKNREDNTGGAIALDFKRMNAYFDIFEILAIPILLYNIRNKKLILLVRFILW